MHTLICVLSLIHLQCIFLYDGGQKKKNNNLKKNVVIIVFDCTKIEYCHTKKFLLKYAFSFLSALNVISFLCFLMLKEFIVPSKNILNFLSTLDFVKLNIRNKTECENKVKMLFTIKISNWKKKST